MTDRFSKPKNSGRKPSYQKRRLLEPDVVMIDIWKQKQELL